MTHHDTRPIPAYLQEAMGQDWSRVYDQLDDEDVTPVVDRLARLAGDSRALELGVGTGRIALPLAQRGVTVDGLDASGPMLAALSAKDPQGSVTQIEGDMAAPLSRPRAYGLIYVINNTLSHLLSQSRQMDCILNAAAALSPGGHFVIEGNLPAVEQADQVGEKLLYMDAGEVRLRYAKVDPASQVIRYQIARMTGGRVTLFPMSLRYIWPSELDLMAAIANLQLVDRFGDWDGTPFEGAARRHVSIYRKRPGGQENEQGI
ncbi:class I SAM-dependent methyltransferase [Tropicibacter sp. S64]|uniref:class I SAM-dependent methyltransferase n=1 Tax=Tropicibacter sp. S64 TaxID=3415122 RepID=UPI003C7C6902